MINIISYISENIDNIELRTAKSFSFYQNIYLIFNYNNISIVLLESGFCKIRNSNKYILDKLYQMRFNTHEGYVKSVKNVLNYKYNIPLYIDENNIFIKTKNINDYDNIWINYHNIIRISNSNNQLVFHFNNTEVKLSVKAENILKQIDKIEQIADYLNK